MVSAERYEDTDDRDEILLTHDSARYGLYIVQRPINE